MTLESDGLQLSGTKTYVVDGHTADLIVVAARQAGTTGRRDHVLHGAGRRRGLTRTPLETLDMTRKQAELIFDRVTATTLGEPGAGWPRCARRSNKPLCVWPPSASVGPRRRWTWPSSTRKTATSSVVRSARSSRSSTSARTCCCASSRRSRPRTTRRGPRPRTTRSSRRLEPRQGVLHRVVLRELPGEHPDPRRHRLHLRARLPPLLPASEDVGAPARRPDLSPRADRDTAGHLSPVTDAKRCPHSRPGVRLHAQPRTDARGVLRRARETASSSVHGRRPARSSSRRRRTTPTPARTSPSSSTCPTPAS